MNATDLWWYFWNIAFAVAGTSFALIAVVVMIKGVGDLKEMLRMLSERKPD